MSGPAGIPRRPAAGGVGMPQAGHGPRAMDPSHLDSLPSRVIVENVQPEIDAGRFAIKRTVGERVEVTADVYVDGHDLLVSVLRFRAESGRDWTEVPMAPLGNDRWRASFDVALL